MRRPPCATRAGLRLRLAGEQRGLDRGERARELAARRIGVAGEREHGGERVVGEQLAIELAKQPHRVPAIDRVVVARTREPVRGRADLLDGDARLAQRGLDITRVERRRAPR